MDVPRIVFVVISMVVPIIVVLFAMRSLWAARSLRTDKWPSNLRVSVEDVLRRAKTGDLVLFSGQGGDSGLIKGWSWNPWSHCGIVVRDPNINGQRPDGHLYLWHANVNDTRLDAIQHKSLPEGGTQLNDLEVCLRAYNGVICWRPISREIPHQKFNAVLKDLSENKFCRDYWDLLGVTGTPIGNVIRAVRGEIPPRLDQYFCSGLAARSYQLAGALGDTCIMHIHPSHFTENRDAKMPWQPPYRLESEYLVNTEMPELPFFSGD